MRRHVVPCHCLSLFVRSFDGRRRRSAFPVTQWWVTGRIEYPLPKVSLVPNVLIARGGIRTRITERKEKTMRRHRHRARSWDAFDLLTEMVARLVRTNLLVKGWVSTDRSEVAALLITTPRPRTKSSTNDLTPPRRMGWISLRPPPALIGRAVETSCCGSTGPRRRHRQNQRRRASAISLPPDEGVRKISSHIRAGFWLRGVQP